MDQEGVVCAFCQDSISASNVILNFFTRVTILKNNTTIKQQQQKITITKTTIKLQHQKKKKIQLRNIITTTYIELNFRFFNCKI